MLSGRLKPILHVLGYGMPEHATRSSPAQKTTVPPQPSSTANSTEPFRSVRNHVRDIFTRMRSATTSTALRYSGAMSLKVGSIREAPSAFVHRRRLSRVVWLLTILAALSIGRSIVSQNAEWIDLHQYALLQERSPFQERIAMAPVLRFLGENPAFRKAYLSAFRNTVASPEELAVSLVNCVCLLLLLPVVRALRAVFSPAPQTSWLAPLLTLLVVAFTYVVHYEQRFSMPYDIPSLLFFSLGLLCVVHGRGWLLLLLLLVAVPNRETAVFLVPLFFGSAWAAGQKQKAVLISVVGLVVFFVCRFEISRILHSSAQPYDFPWRTNLVSLLMPIHWPQLATVFGFLLLPMWLLRGYIRDRQLRLLWLGTVPFLLGALVVGIWKETRIFGELSALVAVTFAVQLESTLAGSHPEPDGPGLPS